jgi:hypothetical protein
MARDYVNQSGPGHSRAKLARTRRCATLMGAMGATEREGIVAGNEALFRRVNEAIDRGRWPGEDASAFRCECAQSGCSELLDLGREQYEGVRAHPRRFVVAPGHEEPRFELVVERQPRHVVVEKRGQAGAIAEATDPRG